MMSTRRCPALQALSHRLRVHAKLGPAAFERYLLTPEFRNRFNSIPQDLWRRAMRAIAEAEALCAKRAPLPPPVKPRADANAGKRGRWQDPAAQAKLRAAYAKAGNDHDIAGRILRITADAARRAKQRYLDAPATLGLQKAA